MHAENPARPEFPACSTALFGQGDWGFDMKVPADTWRSGIRLATTDADGVFPSGDDRVAILGDHAQIPVLQLEVNPLARAWLQMNALEPPQSDLRSPFTSGNLRYS